MVNNYFVDVLMSMLLADFKYLSKEKRLSLLDESILTGVSHKPNLRIVFSWSGIGCLLVAFILFCAVPLIITKNIFVILIGVPAAVLFSGFVNSALIVFFIRPFVIERLDKFNK